MLILKVDQNGELDPQALQKEEKELQKDIHPPVPSSATSAKKDEGIEKQEKVLKQLEEQHKQQKKILEEQKQILEELKQHKQSHEELKKNQVVEKQQQEKSESNQFLEKHQNEEFQINEQVEKHKHEELKNNELVQKQEISNNNEQVSFIPIKNDIQPISKVEPVKNSQIVEDHLNTINNIKQETLLEKKVDAKPFEYLKNISVNNILEQEPRYLDKVGQQNKVDSHKIPDKVLSRKPYIKLPLNESVYVKNDLPVLNNNLSVNTGPRSSPSALNIPSSSKGTAKFIIPEDLKSNEMHVKRRETLEKKNEFDGVVYQGMNDNLIPTLSDQNRT